MRPELEVGFSRVRSLALDPRGGIWVADEGEKRLSYWSDAGEWIEDRGRVGAGPGEFATPYSIAMHDGGLIVHDVMQSRILRFALSGGTDSSWHSPFRITGGAIFVRFFPSPDGPRAMGYAPSTDPEGPRQLQFASVTGGGVPVIQPTLPRREDSRTCEIDQSLRFFSSPFAPSSKWIPLGNGSVAVVDGDYRLEHFDATARQVLRVQRPVSRDPVSEEEYRDGIAEWEKFQREAPGAVCRGELVRYQEKPAIRGLFPADDGALWVELRRSGELVYEIWNGPDLVAELAAPGRDEGLPPAILGDRIAVAVESEDGGHEVRVYRVRQ